MAIIGIVIALCALAWLGYMYRDTLAAWWPGLKHGLVGWPTAIGGGVLALFQFLQGQEAALTVLFKNNPAIVPIVTMFFGLAILVLSWITPRAD